MNKKSIFLCVGLVLLLVACIFVLTGGAEFLKTYWAVGIMIIVIVGSCLQTFLPDTPKEQADEYNSMFTSYFKIELTDGTIIETSDSLRVTELEDDEIEILDTKTGEQTEVTLIKDKIKKHKRIRNFYPEKIA